MKVTIDDTPFEIVLKYAAKAEEAEQPEVGAEAGQPEAGAEAEQPEAGEEAAIVAEIAAVTDLSSDEMVNDGPNLLISSSCLDFIDVTIAIGGAVQESSSGLFSVATGTEVVVTATPKAGSGVQPEDINFKYNQFGMEQINTVSENGSRVLTFTKAESSDNAGVVVEITPPEGCALVSINPNQISNGTVTSNVAYARAGDQIIITATPDEGYEVSYVNLSYANPERDEWNGNVVKVYFTAPDPLPASPITVSAYFGAPSILLYNQFDANYCDLAVTINGKAAAGTNGGYQYNASIGDEITVTATPKNNGTIRPEYSYLTVKEEHIPFVSQSDGSYVASFTRQGGVKSVNVNLNIDPPATQVKASVNSGSGTVSIAVDGEVKETTTMQNNSILAFANKGAVVTITATPGENYCLLSGAFRFNGKYYDGEPVGESGARTYTFTKEEHPDTVEVVFATANTDATITIAGNGEEETFNRMDNGDRFEVKEGKLWFTFPKTTKGYPSVSDGKKLAYREVYGDSVSPFIAGFAGNAVVVYGPAKYAVEAQATVPVVCKAENGTLTCSVDSVAANERFTVTATANQGFQVGGVTATYAGNSIFMNYSEGNPHELTYTFTAPTTLNTESADPVTVTATFTQESQPQPVVQTNINVGEFDKEYCDLAVTINGEPATNLSSYGYSYYAKDGDTVVMTATPKKGATLNPYGFNIYQNGNNINAVEKDGSYVLTFTKSGDSFLYVNLNVIPPADVVTINQKMGNGAVTIAVNGQVLCTAIRSNNGQNDEPIASASVNEGDTVVITATPGDGYCLMEESFGKQEIGSDGNLRNMEYADGTPKGNDGVREYSFVKGSGAVEVDVWFQTSQCTVTMTGNGATKEYSKKNDPDLFKGRQGTQCFYCPDYNPFGSTQAGQKVVYTRGGSDEAYSAGSWIQLWGSQNITLTAELRGTVPVEISQVEHGMVTCNVSSAAAREEIIITATPDQGYFPNDMRVECGGTPLNCRNMYYDGDTAEWHYIMPTELPTSPVTVTATFRYNGGGMDSANTSIFISNSDYGEITGITVDGVAQAVPQGSNFWFETKTGSTVVITAKPRGGGSLNPNEMSANQYGDRIATAVSKPDGSCELTFKRTSDDHIHVNVSFSPPDTAVIASIDGDPDGGTVSIAINGVTKATTTDDKWSISAEANVGDKITVTATPNAGYCLLPGALCWEGEYLDGEAVGNSGARTYTLTKDEWTTYVDVRFAQSDVPSITLNGGGQSKTYTRQANPAQFVARKGIWNFIIPADFNPLGNAPSGQKLVFTDVPGEYQDGAEAYSPGSAYELYGFYYSDEIRVCF